jgi:O-antigen/teichoic acid export membrane protein
MPGGVGIAIVSRQVVLILFGNEFAESGPVLALFGITIALLYPTMAIGIYAVATGRVRFYGLLLLVMTALTVPLDLLLVPWADRQFSNGAIGGALSYIVTNSIILVVGIRVLMPAGLASTVRGRAAKILIATAAMAGVAWPLRDYFIAVPMAAGAGVYGVLAVVLHAIDRSEIDTVRRLMASMATRVRRRRA